MSYNYSPTVARNVAVVVTLLVLVTLYALSPATSTAFEPIRNLSQGSKPHRNSHVVSDKDLRDVLNNTVGFQNVFVVSLPTRSDRLDAFTVQAHMTGIDVTPIHAVAGTDVIDKALPAGMDKKVLGEGAIGCWRSHMDIYQRMVRDNISSALIFEDDSDWDIGFKYQMLDVARGTRYLLNSADPNTNSPYGDDWDLLWIGHSCIKAIDERMWVTPNDPTVIPPKYREETEKPDMAAWEETRESDDQLYTRILFRPNFGWGTVAYAISLKGALKMLLHQSMLPYHDPVDIGIGKQCANPGAYSNFTCIAPFPRIVAESFAAGSKGGDVVHNKMKTAVKQPQSPGLMNSVRLNIDNFLTGATSFKPLYAIGPQEITLADMAKIKGHGELVVEDYDSGNVTSRTLDEDTVFTF